MKIYSYVLKYDDGFAPNPFHGYLTLVTCKPDIRKAANVGDYVIGTGSAGRGDQGNLMYIMEVTEVISMEDYGNDPRFKKKIPNMEGVDLAQSGDNIYIFSQNGEVRQRNSLHSHDDGTENERHKKKDLRGKNALISNNFIYFGENSVEIPSKFNKVIQSRRGYKILKETEFPEFSDFIAWAYNQRKNNLQFMGAPAGWKK